jgi:hypothetical protein
MSKAPSGAPSPIAAPPVCPTCQAALSGRYCSRCGEQRLDLHALTVRHFLSHSLLHEITHIDGKVPGTLKYLLFRPGFLTNEYFAGRRKPYINPIRLLLIALVLFALLAPSNVTTSLWLGKVRLAMLPPGPTTTKTIQETIERLDLFGLLATELARVRRATDVESKDATEKFHHELKTYGTALSFGNVLLVALLLFALLHRRRPYLVEHVVFSLHLAAFVLLFTIPVGLLSVPLYHAAPTLVLLVLFVALFVELGYLYVAIRRFYFREPARFLKLRVAGTVLTVFLGNSVFLTLVYLIGAAVALARL